MLRLGVPDVILLGVLPIRGRCTEDHAQPFQRRGRGEYGLFSRNPDVSCNQPTPVIRIEVVAFVDIHLFDGDWPLAGHAVRFAPKALQPRPLGHEVRESLLARDGYQATVKNLS